ncbi:glycosyltransferase family 4 protein, partial [Vibrio sp. MarTm2]|uniref:glycosyltransferase family 4 protein n=1 Tax=Vibrio sp. MarTm2 TaxID=2998831 RepID=UPI0022CDB190
IGAINACIDKNKDSVYYVHEEFSLNRRVDYGKKNTFKGKFLRGVRKLLDVPFFLFHKSRNLKALNHCNHVVVNSAYIKREIKNICSNTTTTIYPFTEVKNKYSTKNNAGKYITMVGSGEVKGISIFLDIARKMPNVQFRVVGRNFNKKQVENVLYHPFFDDIEELYTTTKILLVPSIWQEAFGKVSVEAASFGVPVIVSNRGGLPETVVSDELIVKDIYNSELWVEKVNTVLSNRDYWALNNKKFVQRFDHSYDYKKLRNLIEELIGE